MKPRLGWIVAACLAAAAGVRADETREVDARILEDLEFYRYLDVLETEPLLRAIEGEEETTGADSERKPDRGGESQ